MTTQLRSLHLLWCKLTGQSPDEIKYAACERMLFNYVNSGYTEDNLLVVLTFLNHQNRKASDPKFRTHLRFHKIMEIETFASYLGEAGPWFRNRKPPLTPRDSVLAATGRSGKVEGKVRHISELIRTTT